MAGEILENIRFTISQNPYTVSPMKILIFFFPFLVLSQNDIDCSPSCNETPSIHKIIFTPPNQNEDIGIITISGDDFPVCKENAIVTLAQKPLKIITINKKEIQAQINRDDYQNGSYQVQVGKTNCRNISGSMDATISDASGTGSQSEFTTRKTSAITIYPYSYAEVSVVCNSDETPISGGFIFATWEVKLVSSYPDGKNWNFKVYNNESLISSFNEFYAICVR
jgi:hypothetical protein